MPMTAEEMRAILEQAISQPKRMTGDAGSVINQSLVELAKVHMYLAGLDYTAQLLAGNPGAIGLGVKVSKLQPPGAIE